MNSRPDLSTVFGSSYGSQAFKDADETDASKSRVAMFKKEQLMAQLAERKRDDYQEAIVK